MFYKPLRHIFRTSEQKLLLGLSQANLIGMAAGGFVAMALLQRFPGLPFLLTIAVCVLLGTAVTFRWAGWPIYLQLYRAARYELRHTLQPQAYDVDSTTYYRSDLGEGLLLLPVPDDDPSRPALPTGKERVAA
jgi:pimeloyl-ACP methyl ester carboxylesterase